MRHKGARFGRDADAGKQLVDLAMQRRERFVRLDPGPDHMRPALPLEQVHPGDPRGNLSGMERATRRRAIFRLMMVDLADETPRQVQLPAPLPTRARTPTPP